MKRTYFNPRSRAIIALHVTALLAGCATVAEAPRYGSIKDDSPAVAQQAPQPAPRPVVKVAARPQQPAAAVHVAPKAAAKPITRAEPSPEPPKAASAPLPPVSGPLPSTRATAAPEAKPQQTGGGDGERASSAARRGDPQQKADAQPAAQPPAVGPAAAATPPAAKGQAADNAGKQAPAASGPADNSITAMLERAEQALRTGKVMDAREALMPGVKAANASAVLALARTYDPIELRAFPVPPGMSDPVKATELYTEAARLGSPDARQKLERLKALPPPASPAKK